MKKLLIITTMILGVFSLAKAKNTHLILKLSNIEGQIGQHYEGWNIVNGSPLSTGRFNLDSSGRVYKVNHRGQKLQVIGTTNKSYHEVPASQTQASLFVLTIEPNNDQDPAPSSVHIAGGPFINGVSFSTADHSSAIGVNFNTSRGSFILAAPTGGPANQGVWFLNPQSETPSLALPGLNTGWAYEGWIVNTQNGAKISTGTFRNNFGADSDGPGIYAGPDKNNFPPFPGQDIVQTPVEINDGIHAIVITVEPSPDFDPRPSNIKILKKDVGLNATTLESIELNNISSDLPSVKAYFH